MTAFWLIAFIAFVAGGGGPLFLFFILVVAGAGGGVLGGGFGGQVWFPPLLFAAVSALTLALVRPAAARFIRPRRSPTNADRVVDQTASVTETIDNEAGTGQVNVLGQVWTARSALGVVIPAGTQVKVQRIEGVKVFVETL